MPRRTPDDVTILVADDDQRLADRYTGYLDAEYDEVLTAYGGEEARRLLACEDVDVALLDRRMPDVSGDELLAFVSEEALDCRVALLAGADPGFDIIDMGCDECLLKPVSAGEVVAVVDRLVKVAAYSEKHQRLTAKKLKRNLLEVEKRKPELEESDRFRRLQAEIRTLEAELDALGEDLPFEAVQRHI